MPGTPETRRSVAIWSIAAVLMLLPLLAMAITDEMNWDLADFAVFGTMLVTAGGLCELAARLTSSKATRAAAAVAVAAGFVLVWLELAVGIVGD